MVQPMAQRARQADFDWVIVVAWPDNVGPSQATEVWGCAERGSKTESGGHYECCREGSSKITRESLHRR